jgi:hypothetical protein
MPHAERWTLWEPLLRHCRQLPSLSPFCVSREASGLPWSYEVRSTIVQYYDDRPYRFTPKPSVQPSPKFTAVPIGGTKNLSPTVASNGSSSCVCPLLPHDCSIRHARPTGH